MRTPPASWIENGCSPQKGVPHGLPAPYGAGRAAAPRGPRGPRCPARPTRRGRPLPRRAPRPYRPCCPRRTGSSPGAEPPCGPGRAVRTAAASRGSPTGSRTRSSASPTAPRRHPGGARRGAGPAAARWGPGVRADHRSARLARAARADTTARAAVEDDEALELPASLAGRDRPEAEPDAADAWWRTARAAAGADGRRCPARHPGALAGVAAGGPSRRPGHPAGEPAFGDVSVRELPWRRSSRARCADSAGPSWPC